MASGAGASTRETRGCARMSGCGSLVSSSPGVGHLLPLLPVARAARERGHDVVVAGGASLRPIVEAAGFRFVPMGPASTQEVARRSPVWPR